MLILTSYKSLLKYDTWQGRGDVCMERLFCHETSPSTGPNSLWLRFRIPLATSHPSFCSRPKMYKCYRSGVELKKY
jgi:hypothetical protein